MQKRILRYSIGVCLLLLLNNNLIAQKHFELKDVALLTGISDPQIAPDGKTAVVVVSKPDYDHNRYNTQLVTIDIPSGTQHIISGSRENVSQPRWSPSGKVLAFLSRAGKGKDSVLQLFIISKGSDDAKQITNGTTGVQHYSWNPSGTSIAFVKADVSKNKAEIEKGFSVFEVGNNDMFIGAETTPSHIWLVSTVSLELKRLTSGEWSLPVTIPPGAPSSPLSWSPDGTSLLFVKVPTPHSGDGPFRTIQILNINDGSIKPLTSRKKFESYPTFSPDGQHISYWYKKDGKNEDINQIWVTSGAGGEGKNVTSSLDRDIYRSIWMPDGKHFLTGGHEVDQTCYWIQSLDGKTKKLNLEDVSPSWSFWIDASISNTGSIIFTGSKPTHPNEVYLLSSADAKPLQLTHFNDEVANMTLGKSETINWENDGLKNCGILTYPVNFEKGKKYPLVLVVHGGPSAASVENFYTFAQLLANDGYFVFQPNYRGSDNQGSAYKRAIVMDAGAGPGRDVMAGLNKLKHSGQIDTSKIAVSGWSYGGYMTVWLAGHYSGWKAAVSGAAVTDWVDQYNLGDANVARGTAFGGSPWVGNNMKKYIDQSPITAASHIKAPTLILANVGDPRVPITQSYKLFHVLKDNGIETRFFAWPIGAHNASDPISQMERDRLWISWLDEHLKSKN
ncbi:MAG: S9 family peptidase [Ginsengibacter sp.]